MARSVRSFRCAFHFPRKEKLTAQFSFVFKEQGFILKRKQSGLFVFVNSFIVHCLEAHI